MSDATTASVYAQKFRQLAERFDRAARDEAITNVDRPDAAWGMHALHEAGEAVIGAADAGFLVEDLPDLEQLIAWSRGLCEHPRQAPPNLKESPTNVFLEVVGGGKVEVVNRGDGRVEVTSNTQGGLLAEAVPQAFTGTPWIREWQRSEGNQKAAFAQLRAAESYERKALVCRILADMLEQTAIPKPLRERILARLSDAAHPAAAYIFDNPGCAGKEVAKAAHCSHDHFRRRVWPKLRDEFGFWSPGRGHFPPPPPQRHKSAT
jgi:hypothetical protein